MRLATFNVASGRSLADGVVEPARLSAAVAALDADVVGLQEVDRGQPRSGYADLAAVAAEALGAVAYRFVPALVGTPGGGFRSATGDGTGGEDEGDDGPQYGVALLSRWPVTGWRVCRLPGAPLRSPVYVAGPRGGVILLDDEPRVLVAAIVETPAGPLTVATTHLSFVPGWNVYQLRRAVSFLRTLPSPRLLLADLNLPAALAGRLSGWRSLARCATYPSPEPRVQLDHVLLDRRGSSRLPSVAQAWTPEVPVSDHRPLVIGLAPVAV